MSVRRERWVVRAALLRRVTRLSAAVLLAVVALGGLALFNRSQAAPLPPDWAAYLRQVEM